MFEYQIRTDPTIIRRELRRRDKSTCARCGLDCLWLARFLRSLEPLRVESVEAARLLHWEEIRPGRFGPSHHRWVGDRYVPVKPAPYLNFRIWFGCEVLGLSKHDARRRTYWEADHTVTVAEGGVQHGLENLVTLCLWCHREKTRHDVRRIRKARSAPGQ